MGSIILRSLAVIVSVFLFLFLPGCTQDLNSDEAPTIEINLDLNSPVVEKSLLKNIHLEPTAHDFAFSGDGRFFSYNLAAQASVYQVRDLDGKEYPLESETGIRGNIAWQDNRFAYISRPLFWEEEEEVSSTVHVYDTPGGSCQSIHFPQLLADWIPPLLAEDGTALFAVSERGIHRFSFQDEAWETFLEFGDTWQFMNWNGKSHAALQEDMNGACSLHILDLATGGMNAVYESESGCSTIWDEDGRRLLLIPFESGHLMIIDVEGEVEKIIVGEENVDRYQWVPGRNMISFLNCDDRFPLPSLVIVDLDSGDCMMVEIEDKQYINFGYVWAGSNRLLLYYDLEPDQDATIFELYDVQW